MIRRSVLDKPIISWEDFDRLFDEAFVTPTRRATSPEPIRSKSSDTSLDQDDFAGFLSEDEIPMYTPMLFPTLRRESSGEDSLRSDSKRSASLMSQTSQTSEKSSSVISQSPTPIPRRPRLLSNQVSSSKRLVSGLSSGYASSTGSIGVPRAKRTNSKPKAQFQISNDGIITMASMEVPDILKDSLAVDFHRDHLVVNWKTATIIEKVLKDSMIRERKEKRYSQTVMVPDGTKFENIKATLKGRMLTISFPTNPKNPGVRKDKA